MKKKHIQIVLDPKIEQLLTKLATDERRTRSAIVELALLAYAKKGKNA